MSASVPPAERLTGWRYPRTQPSLPESHATIHVPVAPGFWRKALAFAGPGYLVAVGYMDPGNWATDLAGGARFGYTLLSVVLLSNLMAILLQALALRLGIVSGRDLAQARAVDHDRLSRGDGMLGVRNRLGDAFDHNALALRIGGEDAGGGGRHSDGLRDGDAGAAGDDHPARRARLGAAACGRAPVLFRNRE